MLELKKAKKTKPLNKMFDQRILIRTSAKLIRTYLSRQFSLTQPWSF